MAALTVVSRLIVASVFLIAGSLKLRQRAILTHDVQNYGFSSGPAKIVAALLPPMEMAVALGLYSGVYGRVFGGISVLLLVAFILLVARAILRKDNVSCSCFGLLYREPVGTNTLVRDSVLLLLSVLVLTHPGPSFFSSLSSASDASDIAVVLATLLTAAASLLLIGYVTWPRAFRSLTRHPA